MWTSELAAPGPRCCFCPPCPDRSFCTRARSSACPRCSTSRDSVRQDPIWHRTSGVEVGRDGCRVPLPWTAGEQPFGFSPAGATPPWLPQPAWLSDYAVERLADDPGSMLSLYRVAVGARPGLFGDGLDVSVAVHENVLELGRESGAWCLVNLGTRPIPIPERYGTVVLSSVPLDGRTLPADSAAWLA
jgi:alpha-glucosidase